MLTTQVQGYLRELISEEKYKASQKDPFIPIKEIHVGYVHVDLEPEFIRASESKKKFLLCEMDGIPIIVNHLCETGHKVVFENLEEKHDLTVGGVRPSRTWLQRYGKISRKEAYGRNK